jgi:prevent-host-death family protein
MRPVNIYEAKARFSQLVDKAASGEDVVVCRNGEPIVRITRLEDGKKQRIKFGVLKGKLEIAADFDAPLPPTSWQVSKVDNPTPSRHSPFSPGKLQPRQGCVRSRQTP